MAEMLGIVGTGVSIASLAIQIFDSIQRIKEFCRQVRDAPKDLQYIVDDLSIINGLLSQVDQIAGSIERNERIDPVIGCENIPPIAEPRPAVPEPEDTTPGCLLIRKSVAHCKAAVDGLDKLVTDLNTCLITSQSLPQRWHSFRAVRRKGEIDSVKKDIESAKGTLNLVIAFRSLLLHEQHREMADQLFQMMTGGRPARALERNVWVAPSAGQFRILEESSPPLRLLPSLEMQPVTSERARRPLKLCRCSCELEIFPVDGPPKGRKYHRPGMFSWLGTQ